MNSFFKIAIASALVIATLAGISAQIEPVAEPAVSQQGSRGREVEAIQQTLKDYGVFYGEVTGYYGSQTEAAVRRFQRYNGMKETGIADAAVLKKLGISVGATPASTQANVNLLARIISAEGRGEPYEGQVAIGAVILNRVEHPSFPDTLAGVIYQPGAFTAITDGQFNEPVANSSYSAARDALNGWDPSGGAIYYFNPAKTTNKFIWSRKLITVIGAHRFCA
ncbi:MAG: spore cortex-lytic enzyme [Oscillospiraceae bacterium]|nr:spore cortex-lytic enzyme [Oscillospiraceae bacterium]